MQNPQMHSRHQKLETITFSLSGSYKTKDNTQTQLMKTHAGNMLSYFRHETKLTSTDDRNRYLCFGHDVCGQLHDSKVPLSNRPLDLVVPDLDGRRSTTGSRYLGLLAAAIHSNKTTGSNLYAASNGHRCHIPRCYEGR